PRSNSCIRGGCCFPPFRNLDSKSGRRRCRFIPFSGRGLLANPRTHRLNAASVLARPRREPARAACGRIRVGARGSLRRLGFPGYYLPRPGLATFPESLSGTARQEAIAPTLGIPPCRGEQPHTLARVLRYRIGTNAYLASCAEVARLARRFCVF